MRGITTALCFLALTGATAATATPIIIGAPADPGGANCLPFGCALSLGYQQVYAAGNFSGAVTLSSITFYNTVYNSGGTANGGVFQLSLSTTGVAVNALSTNLPSNLGGDNTLVYTGAIYTPGFGNGMTLVFDTAFNYDPSGGNLLLDVLWDGAGGGSGVYFDVHSSGPIFSRAYDYGVTGTDNNLGLVTGFNVSVAPEPANWAMLIAGFGLTGAALRRRRIFAAA